MSPVSRARKVFDWVAGITLLLLGVVGLVLPGLQGVLLIIGGLALLSSHSALARRALEAMKSRARRVRDRLSNREPR